MTQLGFAGRWQRTLQLFHVSSHDRTWPGTTSENNIGHPNVICQVGERRELAVLIGEREVGDFPQHGQRRVFVLTFHFRQ